MAAVEWSSGRARPIREAATKQLSAEDRARAGAELAEGQAAWLEQAVICLSNIQYVFYNINIIVYYVNKYSQTSVFPTFLFIFHIYGVLGFYIAL